MSKLFGLFGKKQPEETKNYICLKYNPKVDITAYESAMMPLWIPTVFNSLCNEYQNPILKLRFDVKSELEIWNRIPEISKRHFDIVDED